MVGLAIDLTPHFLDEGPDYERAAFGLLEIKASSHPLTTCISNDSDGLLYRGGPYVSGYHLAEWLVWNWWRLRWEPGPAILANSTVDWCMAHCLTSVGEGYLWPDITFSADEFKCIITSERFIESGAPSFSYLGASPVTIDSVELERAIGEFVSSVLGILEEAALSNTNLQVSWADLAYERNDPESARFRRFEAMLGFDPDQTDAARIESWLNDASVLGENALAELATGATGKMMSAKQIKEETESLAFDMNTNDAFQAAHLIPMPWGGPVAWRFGVDAANAVRQQAGLSNLPINNSRLAELAGISAETLESDRCTNSLSWVFHGSGDASQIVLRSGWQSSRRFDVARLIGDRLFGGSMAGPPESLSPATRSHSYRQKAQRSFAAELLSPWPTVRDMLGDDLSQENQEQVADHFGVSPVAIGTLLVNNDRIGRDNLTP